MSAGTNDTAFISKTNSGFPPYLDFISLRTNAINYLGPITSKYWTDYNIHDPGITTLEVLLYALMDLGYRANLPIGELLATGTGNTVKDTNFFTAAEMLGCNPTSIVDYRKLLMDIEEVRNAWLEVDTSQPAGDGKMYINGLYSVYLELEKDLPGFTTTAQWESYQEKVRQKVKNTLQAHRNLCEDVGEIKVLTKKYIGVSADIEVIPGTDVSIVYQELAVALYDFFSPVAPFYTLGQLQQMNVSLDTVFGGRPYTGLPSHGFVLDSDLPERPSGETSIYLSAAYQKILSIDGIKTVRKLQLLDIAGKSPLKSGGAGAWEFPLPDDAIPAFSLAGSAIRWFQNGQLLSTGLASYNAILQMNATATGKVLYPAGPPALDAAVPNDVRPAGLGDYYSIQNDYPLVYGIGPGGLPSTASKLRQSQALQFKAYLLFFDQLLADYLAQLSNLRTIFSLSSPATGAGQTYFRGDVSSVPGLNTLLRFPDGGTSNAGVTLMTPVAAGDWNKLVAAAKPSVSGPGSTISASGVAALSPLTYASAADRDIAIATLTVLFSSDPPAVQTLQQDDGRWIYCLSALAGELVLISKNNFPDTASAVSEATTVLYIGASKDNYISVSLSQISSFSFGLVQTSASYSTYLQTLLEDPNQYTQRRTIFLQHLMARFAETFTDYALLSAGFMSEQEIADTQVGVLGKFLENLPALSGSRGQAIDYRLNGWNNVNTSGFEKRFKAYCGIADWRRRYLCPFEVHKYEDQFNVGLSLAGEDLFICSAPLEKKETIPAVESLFAALSGWDNYRVVFREEERRYYLEVLFYERFTARSVMSWPDEMGAREAASGLYRMWRFLPAEEDGWISEYEYRPELLDHRGRVVRVGVEGLPSSELARAAGTKMLGRVNDRALWVTESKAIGKLQHYRNVDLPDVYMDVSGFNISTPKNVLGKPGRRSFEVLDEMNTFLFQSKADFGTEAQARTACQHLLPLLTDAANYQVRKDAFVERYKMVIRAGEEDLADSEEEWPTARLVHERIHSLTLQLQERLYTLRIGSRPSRWKFNFHLYLPHSGAFLFESRESFETQKAALEAAILFHMAGPDWKWKEDGGEILLEAAVDDVAELGCFLVGAPEGVLAAGKGENELVHLLNAKKEIYQLAAGEKELLHQQVVLDEPSKQGTFVYRLVDKNHPWAYHPVPAEAHHDKDSQKHKAEALRDQLVIRGRAGYSYLEICLGGDNVYAMSGQYYYQVRCRNDYFSKRGIHVADGELVLFESIAGYGTADAAQQAFQQNYLVILKNAAKADNYGDKKFISLKDRSDQPVDSEHESVVFVPLVTRDVFSYAAKDIVTELVKAALSYPVKMEDLTTGAKYRFALVADGKTDWESAEDYPTPSEAHTAFDSFWLLLNYAGNYYIGYDWKYCHYRIGIREVLAESTGTFTSEASAWGHKGVERFICLGQSDGGFHPEMRKDCTYSYFVACRNRKAIHPCTYDTALQRDEVMQKLFKAAGNGPKKRWETGSDYFEILDNEGRSVALIPMPEEDSTDEKLLNRILDLADALWAGQQPGRDSEGTYFQPEEDGFKVRPAEHVTAEKWITELLSFAAYFPVTRGTTIQGGTTSVEYRVEVKLTGFVDLPGTASSKKDCGCVPVGGGDQPYCYLAWMSDAVSVRATDAWNAYRELLPLLFEKENYRPVFGMDTGTYGIELHKKGDIVARNPQFYSYPAMAIQSLTRARAYINTEGLDLVEHLLLRPETIPVCAGDDPCAAVWKGLPTTDAAGEAVLPFVPGVDPYSFVMTVALPAWPERSRKKENRVLLETILQREAPAHILMRILWLTPQDMCLFESFYEGWLNALGREAKGKKQCDQFDAVRFIDFLFRHSQACLADCTECGEGALTGAAADEVSVTKPGEEWLSQINRLYCWVDRQCADKSDWRKEDVKELRAAGAVPPRTVEMAELPEIVEVEETVVIVEVAAPPERTGIVVIAEEEVVLPEPALLTDERQIRRLMASRSNRYQRKIEEWQEQGGEPEPAGKASAFLKDPEPSIKRFEKLIKELLKVPARRPVKGSAKQPRGAVKPAGQDRQILAAILLAFYLDKLCMDMESEEKWGQLQVTIEKLPIRIEDFELFYEEWRPDEMRKLVRNLEADKIRAVIRVAVKK